MDCRRPPRSEHARRRIATERSLPSREDPSRAWRSRAKIDCMRLRTWLILIVQAALVILVVSPWVRAVVPLGVPGEWEWLRVKFPPLWHVACAWPASAWPFMPGLSRFGFKALAARSITAGRGGLADRAAGRGDRRRR